VGEDLERLIRKWALLNALKHGGRAEPGAVMGKVLAERPELRPQARALVRLVESVVSAVNRMGPEAMRSALAAEFGQPPPGEGAGGGEALRLPPLPEAERFETIVTRFAPNPDFVLHLGSARPLILSHDYARMYNGRFLVRFEDTDPRLKKSSLEYYQLILEDMEWLGCRPDEVHYQSDRLPEYYRVAATLLERGGAYICTHRPDEFRRLALASKPCSCRGLPPSKQLERWEAMLAGDYGEGEAVVRVATDLGHPNPAVRDWPALRIIDPKKHPHPRVGSRYRVWPLYNFAAGCDDHLMGITHIIRGKEHYTNMVRQKYLYQHLGWEYPVTVHHGRLGIEGAILSKSRIARGVREGLFRGVDDPRLGTIRAVRRRGFLPEVIRRIIYEVNIGPAEARVGWEKLYAYQRRLADPIAPRYFLVEEPVPLEVEAGGGVLEARLAKHPSNPEAGYRRLVLTPDQGRYRLFIERADAERSLGRTVRLMGALNVRIVGRDGEGYVGVYVPGGVEDVKRVGGSFIHWLPRDQAVGCRLVRPEGDRDRALAEPGLSMEPVGRLVQLERVGFARVDAKEPQLTLYFTCR
jgi:glutamyl-tRNA synthetase